MTLKARCSGCGKSVKAGDDWAGRRAKCPECGVAISFPPLAPSPPPTEDAFQEAIAAEQRIAAITGVAESPPPPPPPSTQARYEWPAPAQPDKSRPQEVMITRIRLPLLNMVELAVGFAIASLIAGVLLVVGLTLLLAALGLSAAQLFR